MSSSGFKYSPSLELLFKYSNPHSSLKGSVKNHIKYSETAKECHLNSEIRNAIWNNVLHFKPWVLKKFCKDKVLEHRERKKKSCHSRVSPPLHSHLSRVWLALINLSSAFWCWFVSRMISANNSRARRLKHFCLTTVRGYRFISSRKFPDRLWSPLTAPLTAYQSLFPHGKAFMMRSWPFAFI